jgi:hypothetical protein
MKHVQVVVLAVWTRQRHDPLAQNRIGTIGRATATTGVDHGRKAPLAEAGSLRTGLARAHSQQLCGRADGKSTGLQSGQNLNLSLLYRVQGNGPNSSSMRTFSLSSNDLGGRNSKCRTRASAVE